MMNHDFMPSTEEFSNIYVEVFKSWNALDGPENVTVCIEQHVVCNKQVEIT